MLDFELGKSKTFDGPGPGGAVSWLFLAVAGRRKRCGGGAETGMRRGLRFSAERAALVYINSKIWSSCGMGSEGLIRSHSISKDSRVIVDISF